jgi:hypothetical protein
MEAHLSVDNLMPFMPPSVLQEFHASGDASIFGFSPGVKHWLKTSDHPRVERWRDDLKRHTMRETAAALKRQAKMAELASAAYANAKSSIRPIAVIDPVLKAHMASVHGRDIWTNREHIADTRRNAPRLFINQ